MQTLVITGSALGFLVGMSAGLVTDNPWSSVIWRSCVAACLAGWMFRWWVGVTVKNLKLAQEERLANATDATEPHNPKTLSKHERNHP